LSSFINLQAAKDVKCLQFQLEIRIILDKNILQEYKFGTCERDINFWRIDIHSIDEVKMINLMAIRIIVKR